MHDPYIDYGSLFRRARGCGETFILACLLCGKLSMEPLRNRCADCGGAIDAIHNLDIYQRDNSPNPLHRYGSLLPLHSPESARWLGDGNTPCFELPDLAAKIGVGRLFVKDETTNPTRSTKDRIASVGLARFAELGARTLVLSSTGNSSTAYARGVQLTDAFELHIFVGRAFVDRLNYPDHPAVTTHVVDGEFVAAGVAGQAFAKANGYLWEGGFFNLSRREGLKLAYLEAFDAMSTPPDHVFQAVSSGMGLLGAYKGALEYRELGLIDHVPAFTAVQQESCAPMASAFADKAPRILPSHRVDAPQGIAHAILRGDPSGSYPYIRDLCLRTGGQILSAPETEIHAARRMLAESIELHVCNASATALAGVVQAARTGLVNRESTVLVNLTGADRPAAPAPANLVSMPEHPTFAESAV